MRELVSYLLHLLLGSTEGHGNACSERSEYFDLAARMIESTVERGQLAPSTESSAFIEQASLPRTMRCTKHVLTFQQQGILQDALREAIAATDDPSQAERWSGYLSASINNLVSNLTNATRDSELPLDRFSVGSSALLEYNASANASLVPAIDALQDSISLQPRNAEGGLWYYNNVANLSAYRGLSYLDGMYSYPLFAILSAARESTDESMQVSSTCDDVYEQFRILYQHCGQPSGLLAHGYDALHNHSWADPVTGASPIIWGRALAWYSLGLLNVLQSPALQVCSPLVRIQLRQLLEDVLEPQLTAVEKSRVLAGSLYGVWQVVDKPYRPGNFVESSASFLTAYTLMRAAKLGLLRRERYGRLSVTELATGIYFHNLQSYLVEYENGTVSLEGTSTVASLREDVVDCEYYISRQVAKDSLLGTSAFILASLEVARDEEEAAELASLNTRTSL